MHPITCLQTCHLAACFTLLSTSISVSYIKTARDVVTLLLIFAKYLSLYLHIFTCTYRGTHTQARIYNQHTIGMATTRHRSLIERGGRNAFVREKALHTHKKGEKQCQKKTNIHESKKNIEHIELSAKLLDYFLRSNRSNINQSCHKISPNLAALR